MNFPAGDRVFMILKMSMEFSLRRRHISWSCKSSLRVVQVDTDMCRAVRASMGVPEKDRGKNLLAADVSAQRVLKIVDGLDMSTSGCFWAADTGEILAW